MLAQILPGFRDFRTPLVTGYLWLLATWILLGKPLPSKARKDGLLGIVNALTEYLSGTVVVVVLSFLAYMIGLLLAVEFKVLTTLVGKYGWTIDATVKSGGKRSRLVRIADIDAHQRFLATDAGSRMQRLISEASARVEKREVDWQAICREYSIPEPQGDEDKAYWGQVNGDPDRVDEVKRKGILLSLAPKLLENLREEIPIMGTKLQKENKDLYDSYDRNKAEAEYRLSVAIPIAVVSILILFFHLAINPWLNVTIGVVGTIAAFILLRKGWMKSQEATSVIISALEIEAIKSNVLNRLEKLKGPTLLTEAPDPVVQSRV